MGTPLQSLVGQRPRGQLVLTAQPHLISFRALVRERFLEKRLSYKKCVVQLCIVDVFQKTRFQTGDGI